ncbi:uncharacterized protein [Amphiura filiformis]|uniref:uncharacterized protein n=1 Tax=Amphiura filiformis TaxID=82378 RepID=UPI003B20BC34
MAQSEGAESQQASKLSAEVEPFIPGQPQQPGHPQWSNNKQQQLSNHYHNQHHLQHVNNHQMSGGYPKPPPTSQQMGAPPGGGRQLTELPRYMTSCYPFVQDSSTGAAPRAPDARWPSYPPPQPPYHQSAPPPQYPPPPSQHHVPQSQPTPQVTQHHAMPNGPPTHDYYSSPTFPPPAMPPQIPPHSQPQTQHPSYSQTPYPQYPPHPYGSAQQAPTQMQLPPQSVPQGSVHGPPAVPQGPVHGPPPQFQVPPTYPGYYPNYPPTSVVGSHYQGGQPSYQTPTQGGGQYPANRSYNNSRQSRVMHRGVSNMPSREHSGNYKHSATHGYDQPQQQQQQQSQRQQHHSRSSSRESTKSKTKTIVYVEISCQTDFPDDIANKTLVERPSTLRKHKSKPRKKSQGNQTGQEHSTSTDSEVDAGTVDSDSGYYSPKHARTNAGVHTHDAATGPVMKGHASPSHSAIPPRLISHPPPVAPMTPPMYGGVGMMHGQPPPPATNYPPPQVGMPPPMSYARILSQAPPRPTPVMHHQHMRNVAPVEQPMAPPMANRNMHGTPTRMGSPQYRGRQTNTQGNVAKNNAIGQQNTEKVDSKKKKKKQKKQRGGGDTNQPEIPVMNHTGPPPKLQDTAEYPELPSGFIHSTRNYEPMQPVSYSAVLQQRAPARRMVVRDSSSEEDPPGEFIQPEDLLNPEAAAHGIRDGKNARKRRKKAIMAAQAAAKEYSEITEEQRQLQENFKKPNKRTKMPIEFDLGDMLAALEKQQQELNAKRQPQPMNFAKIRPPQLPMSPSKMLPFHAAPVPAATVKTKPPVQYTQQQLQVEMHNMGHNPLDTSAPIKRGKEREAPAKKKPSALKRVILKEREEKKRLRTLEESCLSDAEEDQNHSDEEEQALDNVVGGDPGLGLSQDAASDRGSISAFTTSQSDLSPLSQMSPMSMSPLSPGSPLSSGLSSPATGMRTNSPAQITPKIHSRRFREYCNQVLDKDIDACCTTLLQALVRFQDRQYHKDPNKAKAKRRIVMGLREVTKHLKLKKIKCIIVSPNLERIQAKGGLDEALNTIMSLSHEQDVPVIFALGRKALGRAVNKLVPVSVVGVFNYDGAEDMYKNLLDLSQKARDDYRDMVLKFQQEIEAAAVPRIPKQHRHHLGHYRNLSGCSAISFKSVISEPISEDFPDPEPPVDSRGNEIVRPDDGERNPYNTNIYDSLEKQVGYKDVIDKGGSEAAQTEESGTIENCASKASSETIEAKEITEVNNDEDGEDEFEDLDENGAELDAIEAALGDEEGEEDINDIGILKDAVDDQRVAHWVAETQNCLDNLTLNDEAKDTEDNADVDNSGDDASFKTAKSAEISVKDETVDQNENNGAGEEVKKSEAEVKESI